MHAHGQKFRRVISTLGAAAVAGALLTTVTSASATASPAAMTTAFALKGSIAGGITTVQTDQTLTFVFTESNSNQSTVGAYEDLVMTEATNVSVAGISPCVLPGGVAINSDGGPSCEPGFVKPGQHASVVITTTVTGAVSGTAASAQVCLNNESTGATGPCKAVSAKIG